MDTDRFDDQARRGNPWTTAKAAGSTGTKRAGPTGNSAWRGGAIVVAIGCLLLLDNLGIVRFHDVWRYWPALVVAFGVSRSWTAASLAGGFGVALSPWPVLLIGFGVSVLALRPGAFSKGAATGPAPAGERLSNEAGADKPPAAELARAARPSQQYLERIVVKDGARVHIIPVDRLDYAEAQDDYVALHSQGKSYLKEQTISSLKAALDPRRFVRIHRSIVVNLERVAKIEPYARAICQR